MSAVQSHQVLYHLMLFEDIFIRSCLWNRDCNVIWIADVKNINILHKPCIVFVILRPANTQGTRRQGRTLLLPHISVSNLWRARSSCNCQSYAICMLHKLKLPHHCWHVSSTGRSRNIWQPQTWMFQNIGDTFNICRSCDGCVTKNSSRVSSTLLHLLFTHLYTLEHQ